MAATEASKRALVVLAAGIGRRFGSVKQLEPVGPGGATLMEYTIHDATQAGFGRVVFVIRPEMQDSPIQAIGRRIAARVPVFFAHQSLDRDMVEEVF